MKPSILSLLILCVSLPSAYGGDLRLTETDDVIRVTLRGKPVLEYVKTERPVPEGIAPTTQGHSTFGVMTRIVAQHEPSDAGHGTVRQALNRIRIRQHN